VAADATYVALAVSGTLKVRVLALVAAQARFVDFLGSCRGRIEDFAFVAAALNVRAAGAVATFAGHSGLAMRLSQLAVGVGSESLGHFFMAGCAGFFAYKIPRCGVPGLGAGGFGSGWGRPCCRGEHSRSQDQH
jgi:hypothetical protein